MAGCNDGRDQFEEFCDRVLADMAKHSFGKNRVGHWANIPVSLMRTGLKNCLLANLILSLSCLTSCERGTNLSIKDEFSPSFEVTGSGYELFFGISEVTPEKDRFGRKEVLIWAFQSKQRSAHDTWPTIVYGQVIDEFKQTFPDQGSPAPLIEGKLYEAHATIYGEHGVGLWFVMKNGKAVETSKPE